MRLPTLLLLLPGFLLFSCGQSADADIVYTHVESTPLFPGCPNSNCESERQQCTSKELDHYIRENYFATDSFIEHLTNCDVKVSFIVERNGSLSGFRLLEDIGDGCGTEVLRLFREL